MFFVIPVKVRQKIVESWWLRCLAPGDSMQIPLAGPANRQAQFAKSRTCYFVSSRRIMALAIPSPIRKYVSAFEFQW